MMATATVMPMPSFASHALGIGRHLTAVWSVAGGRADHEQELPGQRIEVPGFTIRIAVRLPTEMQRQKIDYPGDHHWQRKMASQKQEHQREDAQQHYVERQDIEVLRLILQQQRLDDRDIGLIGKIIDAEVFVIVLMLHVEGCVKYQRS